jgi:hypothetical protein
MTNGGEAALNLASVIGGDIVGWRGISGAWTVDAILETLAVEGVQRESGTRNGADFQVVVGSRSANPTTVELWIPKGADHISVIELENPLVQNLAQTLALWGPPEWVLEDTRFLGESLVTERIYASRGITLSVAESDGERGQRTQTVIHAQLYQAGSVAHYVDDVAPLGRLELRNGGVSSALKRAFAGYLQDWRGLSGTETIEFVLQALEPLNSSHAPVEKERSSHRFSQFVVERATPPSPVDIWILAGQRYVTLVEYDDPPVVELEGTLAAAGAPALVLKDRRSAEGASVLEYVFANRGLTVSVAEPHAWSPVRSRRATHVQLYRASSAGYYVRYIGPGAEIRPFPVSFPATGRETISDDAALS